VSIFDQLVDQALQNQSKLSPLRIVVEKELLHHDILREMSMAGLLNKLTFIGGTCLRACYGSSRLSEDLDFTGGTDFHRADLANLGRVLIQRLEEKYSLQVSVSEPIRETGNVDTWKLRVVTRPGQHSMPIQRIHIDICAVPSYDRWPMLLRNIYGVDMGTSGLILQAQSREEIFADKIVAFALRPNRIKNRDLWDIGWLVQQGVTLPLDLVARKVLDHRRTVAEFLTIIDRRVQQLQDSPDICRSFTDEMKRFLPPQTIRETVEKPDFWIYLKGIVHEECRKVVAFLTEEQSGSTFTM